MHVEELTNRWCGCGEFDIQAQTPPDLVYEWRDNDGRPILANGPQHATPAPLPCLSWVKSCSGIYPLSEG